MAKNLDELLDKYLSEDEERPSSLVSYTTRVHILTREKVNVMAAHFGKKKIAFVSEILEAAVNSLFERVEGDIDENLLRDFYEEKEKIELIF